MIKYANFTENMKLLKKVGRKRKFSYNYSTLT